MADVVLHPKGEITATNNHVLGGAGDGVVSTWVIAITDNASTGSSITVKGKPKGSVNAGYTAIEYKDRADGTVKAAAIVTANLPVLIAVDAAGLDVSLDEAGISAGGVYVDAIPTLG